VNSKELSAVSGIKRLISTASRLLRGRQSSAGSGSDTGDTLVEVLIALVVIALTAVALLGALATSVIASGEQRGLATVDTVLKSYVEAAEFQIENQPFNAANNTFPIFAGCGTASQTYYTNGIATGLGANGVTLYSPPTGYSAAITDVQYWDGSVFQTSCTPGSANSLNPQQLTATIQAANGTQATLNFVVSNPKVPVGSASQLFITQQPPNAAVTAGTSFPITVTIADSLGHTVTSSTAPVSLSITPNSGTAGATLSGCSNPVSAVNGVASFSCSINLAGDGYSLTASSPGLSSSPPSNTFMVVAGPASQLIFNPNPPGGGAAVAGSPIPSVSVEVTDNAGNVVTSASGKIGLSIGAGSAQAAFDPVSTATLLPLTNGVANFSAGLNFVQVTTPGSYTFVATPTNVNGFTSPITSSSITVAPGPTSLVLAFTTPPGGGPNGQIWASQSQPVVAIQEAGVNQTSITTTVTLAISSSPGAASLQCSNPGTSAQTIAGVATFAGCSIVGPVGSTYQLTATAVSGSGIGSVTSPSFTISVGAPSQLVFETEPGGGVSKKNPLSPQPVLYLEDSGGNLTNSTLSVTATLNVNGNSGASLTNCAANPVTAINGAASFTGCTINKKGSGYTITFSASGLQPVTSNPLSITN
jgi:Tfp pilus assembly protein PilV